MPPGMNDRLLKAKFELRASSHFKRSGYMLIICQVQERDLQNQIEKKKSLERKEKKALLKVRFSLRFSIGLG
jgi:hypothetical protein